MSKKSKVILDHAMRELTVTPNGSYVTSNDMRTNLLENIRRAALKNAKDSYTLLRNMNKALNRAAKTVGLSLGAAAVLPAFLSYTPALGSALVPGSSFWINPITKQMATGTVMSKGVNLVNKAMSGYNSVGEGVGDLVHKATGWNPNNTWLGPMFTEAFNPGWYVSPNGIMNTVGKVGNVVESRLPAIQRVLSKKVPVIINYKGQIRAVGRSKTPIITLENAASITPELWTAAQDAAIARGDVVEAQRLRDLHFKIKDPENSEKVFSHATPYDTPDFNIFDLSRTGQNYILSKRFGKNVAYFSEEPDPTGYFSHWRFWGDKYRLFKLGSKGSQQLRFPPAEVIVDDPNQIKLADAVTYDDNGVRIPLGLRDNFSNPDIRYSWLPWFLGGSAATGTLNNKSNK